MTQGPRLTFFINDQQVTSIIDASFLAGAADPVALEEGHAVVSTFKVWNLP